jgi:hypothetical protein
MMRDMIDEKHTELRYAWQTDIAPYVGSLQSVHGGYTPAKRGIVTLGDGTKVFVKIAVDSMTHRWLKKEIEVYLKLNAAGYAYIPKLLAYDDMKQSMAIEYLEAASFDDHWDKDKLLSVMKTQDALKQHRKLFENNNEFVFHDVDTVINRWQRLLAPGNLEILNKKLLTFNTGMQLTHAQINNLHSMHDGWSFKQDTLIHEDIRADNFGYEAESRVGKLVDWNWLTVGDESLDVTALFVHIYASGFDPYALYPDRYDAQMLVYLICFWLDSILVGNEESSDREFRLRSAQANSVKVCIELVARGTIH